MLYIHLHNHNHYHHQHHLLPLLLPIFLSPRLIFPSLIKLASFPLFRSHARGRRIGSSQAHHPVSEVTQKVLVGGHQRVKRVDHLPSQNSAMVQIQKGKIGPEKECSWKCQSINQSNQIKSINQWMDARPTNNHVGLKRKRTCTFVSKSLEV
jgi:hypothetical protein